MLDGSAVPLQGIRVVAACTVTEFLCSVSHCCDNVAQPLNQNDERPTRSSTDEYESDDVDDSTNQSLPAAIQFSFSHCCDSVL